MDFGRYSFSENIGNNVPSYIDSSTAYSPRVTCVSEIVSFDLSASQSGGEIADREKSVREILLSVEQQGLCLGSHGYPRLEMSVSEREREERRVPPSEAIDSPQSKVINTTIKAISLSGRPLSERRLRALCRHSEQNLRSWKRVNLSWDAFSTLHHR